MAFFCLKARPTWGPDPHQREKERKTDQPRQGPEHGGLYRIGAAYAHTAEDQSRGLTQHAAEGQEYPP